MSKRVQTGRIQKSRKHKKLKYIDPTYLDGEKQTTRNPKEAIERRANARPTSDDQEFPRTVLHLMELKEKTKLGIFSEKKRRKLSSGSLTNLYQQAIVADTGFKRPLKPVSFRQGKKESDTSFMTRVEVESQRVLSQAKFEEKYNVELDAKSNEVVKKQRKLTEHQKERQRLKSLKKKAKKKRKNGTDNSENELLKDNVRFGEVVEQPPQLTAKPRRATNNDGKIGKKLLLASKFSESSRTKKKHASVAEERILNVERRRVIELYRRLKSQKSRINPA